MRLTLQAKWLRLNVTAGPDAEIEPEGEQTYLACAGGDLTVVPAEEYVYEDDPGGEYPPEFGFSPRK